MDTRQTIVALATPPGPAARAIVRLSGADVRRPLRAVFEPELSAGAVAEGTAVGMPAAVYYWAGPNSYTGQDVAEIHVPGCPPLVDVLIGRLIEAGCRPAGPGEFT